MGTSAELKWWYSQGWSWGRTASPKDNSYSDTNSSSTGVNLSTNVPLFTGLQLSNQYSLAKLNLQAAIEDLNKAKEDIAINVTLPICKCFSIWN